MQEIEGAPAAGELHLDLTFYISVWCMVKICSVLSRISQRLGGVGVAKWNSLVGVDI